MSDMTMHGHDGAAPRAKGSAALAIFLWVAVVCALAYGLTTRSPRSSTSSPGRSAPDPAPPPCRGRHGGGIPSRGRPNGAPARHLRPLLWRMSRRARRHPIGVSCGITHPHHADFTPGAGPPPLIGWRSPQHRRTRCRHPPAAPSRPARTAPARVSAGQRSSASPRPSSACWCCSRRWAPGGRPRRRTPPTSSSTSARSRASRTRRTASSARAASRATAAGRTRSRASRPASRPPRSRR